MTWAKSVAGRVLPLTGSQACPRWPISHHPAPLAMTAARSTLREALVHESRPSASFPPAFRRRIDAEPTRTCPRFMGERFSTAQAVGSNVGSFECGYFSAVEMPLERYHLM